VTEPDRSPPSLAIHVLIVDDEPNILRSLARSLSRSYRITTCDTGADALELIGNDGSFDVVVCDLMMPGLDGVELFRRLATVAPHLQGRLLFLTAGAVTRGAQAFIERESTKLLYKPVDLRELTEAIESVAGKSPGHTR